MNITDGDFEFIFNLYDEAQEFIADKDKLEWARKTLNHMEDFGFDLKPAYKEISDHCEYLAEALDLRFSEEENDDDIYSEHNENDEEMDY
tara:strand:- start:651 stop:920 length:270 start_codon:yes stop_codon:yes gene_type:complete